MSFLIVPFDSANSPFQTKLSLGIVAGRSLMELKFKTKMTRSRAFYGQAHFIVCCPCSSPDVTDN
eukprot:scaffold69037_cov38-Cyclotella_meneghiniana.AAC.3